MTTALTGRQARHLRALAHHLDPIVQIGKEGVSDAVVRATAEALLTHELVKVRLPQIDREDRHAMCADLIKRSGAALVGEQGRVAILYRRHPTKPRIDVPGMKVPALRTDAASRRRARPNSSRAKSLGR